MEYRLSGTNSLLVEIGAVVMHVVDEDRSELNAEENEYITRITKRMLKETKMQFDEIAYLFPEEIKIAELKLEQIYPYFRGFGI